MSVQTKNKIRNLFDRIEKTLETSISREFLRPLGQYALDLIVKRTRLGYGVEKPFGSKFSLPSHSPKYIKFRKKFRQLSETTAPTKSNLTLTGQLLESMSLTDHAGSNTKGSLLIAPTGQRSGGRLSNKKLAAILAEKGRTFNYISQLEYNQVMRFYRKSFGDLLLKRRLLR